MIGRALRALAFVAVLAVLAPGVVMAAGSYLALGDSVQFGYNPNLDASNAGNFHGYPEQVAADLGLTLTNASCPGGDSAGFLSLNGADYLCPGYRALFPLHVAYTSSQLDYATAFIRAHPDLALITLQLGDNDFFRLQASCLWNGFCVYFGEPGMTDSLAGNMSTIYTSIRQAGYTGRIVTVTNYAWDYNDPNVVRDVGAVNAGVTRNVPSGVVLADGYGALKTASGGQMCDGGYLIRKSDGTCDIHPTPKAAAVLASEVERVAS